MCKKSIRNVKGVSINMIMKKNKKELSPEEIKRKKLLEELSEVQNDLNRTYTNLENVVDEELIDCLIYELNATQIRYRVILNQVKQLETVKMV